jgi:small multidrug resistance pump
VDGAMTIAPETPLREVAAPSVAVLVAYAAAFVLLSRALRLGMPLTVAYAVWSAVGIALVALVSWLALDEPLTGIQIAGLLLIAAGVATLEAGTSV